MRRYTENGIGDPERFYDPKSGGYRRAPDLGTATRAEPAADGAAKRAQARAKRRRRRLCIFYIVTFLLVLSAGAFLALKVFFKVNSIKVEGTSCYTIEQIKKSSGLKTGENLILADTRKAETDICKKLPYIGTVKVSRRFPEEIVIKVTAAVARGAIQSGGKYILVSADGKVLEVSGKLPANSALIKGIDVMSAKAGEKVGIKDASKLEILKNILKVLDEQKLTKITSLDFSKTDKICIVYDSRVTINLGVPSDIDYKIRFAKNILENKIQSNEKGTLDMSTAAENDRAYFDPDYASPASSG